MKTYKVIFTVFAIMILGAFVITGCSTDDRLDGSFHNNFQLKIGANLIEEYENKLFEITPALKEIVESSEFSENPELYKEDLELVLSPLVDVSQRLMIASGIDEKEVPELVNVSLSDPQIIAVGLLIYSQDVAITTQSQDVVDCIARAFIGIELHGEFWGNFTTRKALLKAVGKVASRFLGVVGAAMVVYDFADCMWD